MKTTYGVEENIELAKYEKTRTKFLNNPIFANNPTDREIPKSTNSSYNSITITKTTQSKNRQKIYIDIFLKRHTDSQQAHEKMLNTANHYKNTNLNYKEVLPHSSQHAAGVQSLAVSNSL